MNDSLECITLLFMAPDRTNKHFFHAMNTLSDHIRRSLFHRPESLATIQSFKLPLFSAEAFWYLLHKVYSLRMYFYDKLSEATGYQVLLQLENGVCCEAEYINILTDSVKSSSRITSAMFRQRNKIGVIGKAPY